MLGRIEAAPRREVKARAEARQRLD